MDRDTLARLDNKDLVGFFVSSVGYDYRDNLHEPNINPDFSEDTVAFWEEIERRMKETVALGFDRKNCLEELRNEIAKQSDILNGGADYSTSYHYGIRSGLNTAYRIVESCITGRADDEAD